MTQDMTQPRPTDHPDSGPRTVVTASGSRYRIDGTRIRKLTGEDPEQEFELVDLHANRLRYTDGERLYISTPMRAA